MQHMITTTTQVPGHLDLHVGPLEPRGQEAKGVMTSWLWVIIMSLVAMLAAYFQTVV